MILRLLKTVVFRQHRHQLQHRVHVLHNLTGGLIIPVLPHLHEVVRHDPEVAREPPELSVRQIGDLKDVHLMIAHERPQFLGDIDPLEQGSGSRPTTLPKIEHQRDHGMPTPLHGQLALIVCALIPKDPKGHVPVDLGLILEADQGDDDTLGDPELGDVAFLLPEFSIRLVERAGFRIAEVAGIDPPPSAEEEDIDDVGEDVVVGLQVFLRHVPFRHAAPLSGRMRSRLGSIISRSHSSGRFRERQLVALHVHRYLSPRGELPGEQGVGQPVLDQGLDGAAQKTGAGAAYLFRFFRDGAQTR